MDTHKICLTCNSIFHKSPSDSKRYWLVKKYCSIKCAPSTFKAGRQVPQSHKDKLKKLTGTKASAWKGGRVYTRNGYVLVNIRGKYILEHRHVMEEKIGRKLLRSENVHHKNGNKLDNRINNLEIIDHREHSRIHTAQRWLDKNKLFRKNLASKNALKSQVGGQLVGKEDYVSLE